MIIKMNQDLKNAINILNNENLTCVLCHSNIIYKSSEKGILPIYKYISLGYDLNNFAVADKVVGKAVAMLFVFAGIKEVYTTVISDVAYEVLKNNCIEVNYEIKTDMIVNRVGNDMCPMEKAVVSIDDPRDAYENIGKTLYKMSLI